MKARAIVPGILLAAMGAFAPSRAADVAPPREELGRSVKLRVLVDKVMQPTAGWTTEEWMVREAAEAGFNVWSPRHGAHDPEALRRVTEWCEDYGVYHMPWMRGTLGAPEGEEADGRRMVWANGAEQPLWSPNADEFWEWTTEWIVQYAQLSAETGHLMGVFLDYENYAPLSQGNGYALSYDDIIMGWFAEAKGIEWPELQLGERYDWLTDQALHDEFEQFQIAHWRDRCRALREAVDEHDPTFQFCIYPAPGTLFMTDAAWHEWATEAAPLILADAVTYGRPSSFLPHRESLQANRRALKERMESVREAGIPFIYAGGIDPIVRGADPEFCGKNAVMISDVTDGYWIFYEGPKYGEDHPEYFRWFTWANQAIGEGAFRKQHEPRETPDEWGLTDIERRTDKPQIALYGMKERMVEQVRETEKFEVHELRGNTLEYLRQLDVVVLQNFNVALRADSPFSRALRKYVREGGGVLLAHDTAWFMATPFPAIAARDWPTQKVEAERHVVETDLQTTVAHKALGGVEPGTRFPTEFRDHMIFSPGPKGTAIVENVFSDPVYVAGTVGKGRVVFSGCYYGYTNRLAGAEWEVLAGVLDWLAGN